ncbi:putative addiction module antidote protein [Rhizobium sp. 32-5/1]|uniref:addiction module antidote protein n=1 Tax=Rhizobium sp. 32-5/1 TaxID=3019602 RepID=UPI00240E97EB|nr:addiction module antidote protein [Rhizobium sp. 32-5/1]WEZ84148.1 putative addiction module antidote protein [Rhizobium sp. 32-5/1]
MKTTKFDASLFLDSEELMIEYLAAAIEDENPDVFLAALGDVAKARGVADIARATGLGRESLYKSLRPGSKLRFETMQKIVGTLGLKLTIQRASETAPL